MATYVLVHGAWGGGYLWKRVATLLRASGHEVYTPTLTGLGERAHLASRSIDLEMHLQDVLNVLVYEDLFDVVLVGHSYGGMVVTGVADRTPERLARLVYVDAFVPENGQALLDLVPPAEREGMMTAARDRGDGWQVPPHPRRASEEIGPGGASLEEQRTLLGRRLPHPLATFTQPLRLTAAATHLPRVYAYCRAKSAPDAFGRFSERFRDDPAWGYAELPTDHFPMLTMPRELMELLSSTASASS
ncbi:MAG TPA: alpha/beta fold hydrolase [Chloroflexota bacterium]|nr:alpha/beta fold hydrolase [Chloroflexota bacterium]